MGSIVRRHLNPGDVPDFSPEERERLLRETAVPESSLDFSDIPASTEDMWEGAVRGAFYRPVKRQVTLRIDANLLDWFRRQAPDGKGYQTDINRVLREYVAAQENKAG